MYILVKTKYAPHYKLAVHYSHRVNTSGNELFAIKQYIKILTTHKILLMYLKI